ncbi:G-box-binding factor 4 [Nymphaea thermarum]|nr:G-box-binding factor 4 [Nymphaea thermarum]
MASKVMASSSPAASDLNRSSIAIAELQTPDASRATMNMEDLIKGFWPADPTPPAGPVFAAEAPKTVEQVWKEIDERRGCDGGERVGEMTLEDFLAKAGLVRDEDVAGGGGSGGFGSAAPGAFGGATSGDESFRKRFGFGEEAEGAARAKRKAAAAAAALSEPVDRAAQQRQRRMIKNRESAARSRERKLAYTMDLQSTVSQLEEENAQLVREQNRKL